MKHTAEPWKFKWGFHDIDACESWGLGSIMGDGYYIAEIWKTVRGGEETATSNAARIVECVNALAGLEPAAIPDLVEAAQGIFPASLSSNPKVWIDAMDKLQAALAKMKEVKP